MSLRYRNNQGTETPVAGLNGTSGELVPSVALYQTGSFEVDSLPAGGYTNSGVITLQTPFPDTDYIITLDFAHSSLVAGVIQKTVSNFKVTIGNIDPNGGTGASVCYWKAYKLMTDTVHQADSAHIAQNTANFAPAFSEVTSYAVGDYCTYNNVLYRCTTAHTAGTWVAGHFTQVTVGGDLSEEPVLLGEWAVVTTAVQTKTLNESVANFRFLLIEVRTLGICRGSGYFRCHRDSSYEYLFRYFYQSAGYATAVTVKSNLTQVDIEIPTLQPSSGVTVSMYGIR